MTDNISVEGPDFSQGVPLASLRDGEMLKGHVRGEPALLVRRGDEVFAIAPACTHYGAPLEDGLLVGDTIRCPWHHACFSLRTGAVLRAPGLGPLQRWRVELSDGMILASEELEGAEPGALTTKGPPASVVIVGGGPSGYAAAATLRGKDMPARSRSSAPTSSCHVTGRTCRKAICPARRPMSPTCSSPRNFTRTTGSPSG